MCLQKYVKQVDRFLWFVRRLWKCLPRASYGESFAGWIGVPLKQNSPPLLDRRLIELTPHFDKSFYYTGAPHAIAGFKTAKSTPFQAKPDGI
jgi:hypothetical protein